MTEAGIGRGSNTIQMGLEAVTTLPYAQQLWLRSPLYLPPSPFSQVFSQQPPPYANMTLTTDVPEKRERAQGCPIENGREGMRERLKATLGREKAPGTIRFMVCDNKMGPEIGRASCRERV